MSLIQVKGYGAVSPAGWSANDLINFLNGQATIEPAQLKEVQSRHPLRCFKVNPPNPRPSFMSLPRLRRSGKLTQYLISSALEAIGEDVPLIQSGEMSLGIISCLMAGNVNYSHQFYKEVLQEPATASPLLFPETVFNASASHLSAILNSTGPSNSIIGDEGAFIQGLVMAAHWLHDGIVDACIVIGAEEQDWLVGEASSLFCRESITSEGAGALYLKLSKPGGSPIALQSVTDSFQFLSTEERKISALAMRNQFGSETTNSVLFPSEQGIPRLDAAESFAWKDWKGSRMMTKNRLGQAFNASTAWQCIAACAMLKKSKAISAIVSVVGSNQQSIAARFLSTK